MTAEPQDDQREKLRRNFPNYCIIMPLPPPVNRICKKIAQQLWQSGIAQGNCGRVQGPGNGFLADYVCRVNFSVLTAAHHSSEALGSGLVRPRDLSIPALFRQSFFTFTHRSR